MSDKTQQAGKKYLLIDKSVINHGHEFNFCLYAPTKDRKNVTLFKKKFESIVHEDVAKIGVEVRSLYVHADEHRLYEEYVHLLSSAEPVDETEAYIAESTLVYTQAKSIMDDLFSNPDALENAQKSKEVVSDLVQTVLHDEFTISLLMGIAEHDYYTHTHSLNVAIYSLSFGATLGLGEHSLSQLGQAALLHDLGKSKVDVGIINKDGKLTDKEFKDMQNHSSHGDEIAKNMGITDPSILSGIRHHHEKIDGSGYPDGLRGEHIPLFARVVGLCDIFDALTSRRSYKEPMSSFEALGLMKNQMTAHIDMDLLQKMILMFR